MLVPALVICVGVVVLVPLSPLLIFGIGPFPALGIAGGGVALVLFYAAGTAVLAWYILSGRNIARLRPTRPRWPLFREILSVGAVAAVTSVQTNVIIALATALVATAAGPGAAAGYGTSARLEYLLVPLVFGLGAPLVAMVGTNVGAGERKRALRIAFVGSALAFAITEAIGVVAAIWPQAWIALFSTDARVIETGSDYLRIVGPSYGFFGLALALYFASQGAGRLFWPLSAGFLRMLVAIAGGWLALRLTGSLNWLFAALALGLVLHGLTLVVAIGAGAWFRQPPLRSCRCYRIITRKPRSWLRTTRGSPPNACPTIPPRARSTAISCAARPWASAPPSSSSTRTAGSTHISKTWRADSRSKATSCSRPTFCPSTAVRRRKRTRRASFTPRPSART